MSADGLLTVVLVDTDPEHQGILEVAVEDGALKGLVIDEQHSVDDHRLDLRLCKGDEDGGDDGGYFECKWLYRPAL